MTLSFDRTFFTYEMNETTIKQTILIQKPTKKTINATLRNKSGLKATYSMDVNFVCNISTVSNQTQNERTTLQSLRLAQNASNFNWADQFAAALLNGQKLAVKPIPDVSISQVTGAGLVRLKFSQPMINPPLELIRSAITPADENRRRLRTQDSNG